MTVQALRAPGRRIGVAAMENFPVAPWLLPPATRHHLRALQAFVRFVGDLGDERQGPPPQRLAALNWLEVELGEMSQGYRPSHRVLVRLAPTIDACRLPLDPLLRLVEANRTDQVTLRYATFDSLVGYCDLAANPVGELVLCLFGRATPARIALSNRICTALQLLQQLENLAGDWQRGRVYLPQDDLDRFDVAEADLGRPHATLALCRLVEYQSELARAWLDAGAPLVGRLRGLARAAIGGYVAGGRAALDALERNGYDPLPGVGRPSRSSVFGQWLRATVRSAG